MNQRIQLRWVTLCMVWMSCSEASVIGEDFIEGGEFELSLNNSLPLALSTMRFDSLITSQSDRLLVGGVKGTEFGDVHVESYFLLNLRDGLPSGDLDDIRYDSVTLTLPMDGYTLYLDETIQTTTVVLEQLAGELEYVEDENALYNYSDILGATDVPGSLMAEKSFFLATDRLRDLEMRLPDAWGRDFFTRMQDDDEIFSDAEEAAAYLRGFRLYLRDPSLAFGITKDSLKVTIHGTELGTSTRAQVEYDFTIDTRPHYSRFEHTEIPTQLDVVDVEDTIPSRVLEDRAFIIAGLGYAAKVDLTRVRDLLLEGEDFILVDAEVRLRWFEQDTNLNPERLTAQFVNEDFQDLANGQQFPLIQSYDDEYGRDNFYTVDVTALVEFILTQPIGGEYSLLVTLEDYRTAMTSVVLGDQSFSSSLEIYTIKN